MIDEEITDLLAFLPTFEETVSNWVEKKNKRELHEVEELEDYHYCLHNAIRSALYSGADSIPEEFDPVTNGGVIHERRHSLTWMLSAGTKWDDTDLST